ncbi:SAM-dependent methyltransferase [Natronosporangium hydrolyticum]|uniref:SAM-dependent methyltransferase n=1 Tax=Natronosporangium hydrolyticum TaxID=2811111 RepID=A0A895YAQ2_9ACTN|nr:SAM-dependent methyltransferase [Natronosporangium hydrolyticum]QSB14471.1 SAM-dependent methyltransferase [Natronosporangium hydrolyticum]
MPEPLPPVLSELRTLLLGGDLIRAVAAGKRRGRQPAARRAELRPVTLRGEAQLQLVTTVGERPTTRNLGYGPPAEAAVDELLAEPFGSWLVEAGGATLQVRVTKSGQAQVHRAAGSTPPSATPNHDRSRRHLLDPGDPLFGSIGADAAKRRQVDAFLRALAATLPEPGTDPERLPQPLHIVDLGCGNAYLTFAAYRWLTTERGLDVNVVGVDVRDDQRARNTALAAQLGWSDRLTFAAGSIADAVVTPAPELVLALHACDTATDDALARAVGWGARWILAAPCCHHDVAAQLRRSPSPPYPPLVRHGILRERFADVLTDSLRASLLRQHGYRVEVVEFIDSQHTPRNLLLRAAYTGAPATAAQQQEYADLTSAWSVTPQLAKLLPPTLPTPPG